MSLALVFFLVDIDECSRGVHHCQHNCLNTPGSYRCNCRAGFDLLQDGGSCKGTRQQKGR